MSANLLLRATCSLTLLGYGWKLSGDSPAWYPRGVAWENEFFLILGILVLVPLFLPEKKTLTRVLDTLLIPASAFIIFFSYQKWVLSGVGIGQFLEHAAQFGIPLLVWLTTFIGWNATVKKLVMVCASAAFIFHGLFAIGISVPVEWLNHPTPDKFYFMTAQCLGLESNVTGGNILLAAGLLDLVAAVAIWIRPARFPALIYMVIWGFLTALARPVAYFDASAVAESLFVWVPEFFTRASHWLLPLILLKESGTFRNRISEPASVPELSRQEQP